MPPDLRDRYCGALLGAAAGDALGAPLEFMSRQQVQIKHGLVKEMIGGGWLSLRPGGTTDDTAMALALARSLAEKKGFDAADVAARYVAWFRSGPPDIGNITRMSLERISLGAPVGDAAREAHEASGAQSAGNGTIMRCAPLALFSRAGGDALIQLCLDEARITHFDVKAGSGSAAVCLVLHGILNGEADKAALVAAAGKALMENGAGAVNIMPELRGKAYTDLNPGGYVADTLETALWCFGRTSSYEECLVRTVNLGGDADTTGAVAGALAGAYYGMEGIPARWLTVLQDKSLIQQVAGRLFELHAGSA